MRMHLKDWPLATFDNLETLETLDTLETLETFNTLDILTLWTLWALWTFWSVAVDLYSALRDFYTRFNRFCVYFYLNFNFYWIWSLMKKQFIKSFLLVDNMEYQNVRASVNFCHLIIGPGMLPGLSNRPKLYSSFSGSPCTTYFPETQVNLIVVKFK